MKENPFVKKLRQSGEAGIGKLVQQLMSNESFVSAIQAVVTRSLSAKETMEKSLRSVMSAMNVPSRSDLDDVLGQVGQLERKLSSLEEKVERLASARTGAKKT